MSAEFLPLYLDMANDRLIIADREGFLESILDKSEAANGSVGQ